MKLKQRPEDFVVREGFRFDEVRDGPIYVYRMDKQKISTLQAIERLGREFGVRRRAFSVCGLKDKQGRTEQLIGVEGGSLGTSEVVQSGDLRLTLIGRTDEPLGTHNITANRFEVTVRDLSPSEAARAAESAREVERVGVVNYFDSQRFGFLKHGQGFIGRQLLRGDFEGALKSFMGTPSELDRSDDAKVKAFWRDHWGEWEKRAPTDTAKKYAPILRRLREDPTDFKGAFLHIERRVRMMTLFELQSYVWNEGVRRYLMGVLPAAEMIGLRYQAGALMMPRSIPPDLREELQEKTFPLLAANSTFTDPAIRTAALGALATQQLTLDRLVVPDTTQLFYKHEERPIFVLPGKLRVNEARPDELNRGKLKVNLSFTLPPGAYATLVVRRIFWFATEGARELADRAQEGTGDKGQRATQSANALARTAAAAGAGATVGASAKVVANTKADAKPGANAKAGTKASEAPRAKGKPPPFDQRPKGAWGQPAAGAKDDDAEEKKLRRRETDRSTPMEPGAEPKAALGFRARQKLKKEALAARRTSEAKQAPKARQR